MNVSSINVLISVLNRIRICYVCFKSLPTQLHFRFRGHIDLLPFPLPVFLRIIFNSNFVFLEDNSLLGYYAMQSLTS